MVEELRAKETPFVPELPSWDHTLGGPARNGGGVELEEVSSLLKGEHLVGLHPTAQTLGYKVGEAFQKGDDVGA